MDVSRGAIKPKSAVYRIPNSTVNSIRTHLKKGGKFPQIHFDRRIIKKLSSDPPDLGGSQEKIYLSAPLSMSFIKRLLSIAVFIFCFLTAIVLFIVLVDSSTTVGDKIYGGIFFFIISSLSFLLARWLWRTAKVMVPSDPIEITDSVIGNIQPSATPRSSLNWVRRTSIILCGISGIVALYIYFVPYKLALSKLGEPAPWLEALCVVADLFEDHIGCRVIGKPFINAIRRATIEEQIASWENGLLFLAVIFGISLMVAFLPRTVAESSKQEPS